MSDFWNVDVTTWWLPSHESPQCPQLVRQIRDFIDYRATIPRDTLTANLRDMKGLLIAMDYLELKDEEGKGSRRHTGTHASDENVDLAALGSGEEVELDSPPDMSWYDVPGDPAGAGAGPQSMGYGQGAQTQRQHDFHGGYDYDYKR